MTDLQAVKWKVSHDNKHCHHRIPAAIDGFNCTCPKHKDAPKRNREQFYPECSREKCALVIHDNQTALNL